MRKMTEMEIMKSKILEKLQGLKGCLCKEVAWTICFPHLIFVLSYSKDDINKLVLVLALLV